MRAKLMSLVATAGLAGGLLTLPVQVQGDESTTPEGCVARPNSHCTYTATRQGGYAGAGSFRIEVTRNGETFELVSTGGDAKACTDAILPGDQVKATAFYGSVAVGNPAPVNDPTITGAASCAPAQEPPAEAPPAEEPPA